MSETWVLCKRHRLSMFVTLIWHLKVPPLTKYVVVFNFFRGLWSGILLGCVSSVCVIFLSMHFSMKLWTCLKYFLFWIVTPLDRHCLVHLCFERFTGAKVTQLLPLGVGSTSGDSTISEVLPMNLVSIQREKSLFPLKIPKSLRRRVSWFFIDELSLCLWVEGGFKMSVGSLLFPKLLILVLWIGVLIHMFAACNIHVCMYIFNYVFVYA